MLTSEDWQNLDQAILVLHKCQTVQELEDCTLHTLPEFIGASFSSWNEHDDTFYLKRIANSSSHKERFAQVGENLNRSLPTHPLYSRYVDLETGRVIFCDQVMRTRANTDDASFYQSEFYLKVAFPIGVEDQLIMHVAIEDGFGIILTFNKDRLFTDNEHLIASILRGHIMARLYTLKQEHERECRHRQSIRKELAKILSPREIQVLEAVCRGNSNREIAESLSLSSRTIDSHVANLLDRLDASSRFHLVARYAHWLQSSEIQS